MAHKFDVFLSHNSEDKTQVKEIAFLLEERGLTYWLDEDQLQPGQDWQPGLEEAIKSSRATAVFVGPSGFGNWHDAEMQGALTWAQGKKIPVIPVALPGMPTTVELPMFLSNRTWVRFKSVDDSDALDRLKWGITGEPPPRKRRRPLRPQASDDQSQADPVEDAIQNLTAALECGSVTYIIGNAPFADSPELPPCNFELAHELLHKLKLDDAQGTAPMTVAGTCFAILKGDRLLENEVVNMIANGSHSPPPMYRVLANLVDMQGRRRTRRSSGTSERLIVTTNIDVLMERALIAAGLPFSRIVQNRAAAALQVNAYEGIRRLNDDVVELPGVGEVQVTDIEALEDWIQETGSSTVHAKELAIGDMVQPVLYKFHGSQDVEDSCAISTEHYLALARASTRSDFLPRSVQSIIGSTPSLFLGCNPLDPEFVFMYHSLLQEPFRDGTEKRLRYAPMLPPDQDSDDFFRHAERRLWDSIKEFTLQQMGIRILGERPDQFLNRLHDVASPRLAPAK